MHSKNDFLKREFLKKMKPNETSTSFCHASPSLTKKQKYALDTMIKGKNIFLTGPAGTGKTTIISLFKKMITTRIIGLTSLTGISAVLLGGCTLHSYLGIGLGTGSFEVLFERIKKNYKAKMKWLQTDILIIDEISMLSPQLFEKLNMLGKSIRQIDLPFGGIQLILCGDFLQLPVVRNSSFCFESKVWNECIDETVYLNEIVRQIDPEFQNILGNVRIGNITKDVKKFLNTRIVSDEKDEKDEENKNHIKPTRLYTTNKDVDAINEIELYKLNDGVIDYFQYDLKIDFYVTQRNEGDYIQRIIKSCPVPSELIVCKGAQVMLMYNMDVECGLANGSRGIVVDFDNDLPIVEFLNGQKRKIEFHNWEIEDGKQKILKITQIPLKLAWSLTVHKAQSCTLDLVKVDLNNVFEYGQAYVALSRVRTKEGLGILNINYEAIKAHPKAIKYYDDLIEKEKESNKLKESK